MRVDKRTVEELRPLSFVRGYISHAEGSVLVQMGQTKIICTVSVEDKVPPFLKGSGKGWITAEYAMLPRATAVRNQRESVKGKIGGRTHEIQRLIGRALRAVVDLSALGEKTLWVDCDVIEADGGTRTASINGAYVAMCDAFSRLKAQGRLHTYPVTDYLAAVSVGVVGNVPMLDLCYIEDAAAQVDMNVVMTGSGKFVEVQGSGEEATFSRDEMQILLSLAELGITEIIGRQAVALGGAAQFACRPRP
ncbi:MAG: Ribonuclease PH [Firmicutes bacterium]|nr:Ribonuclease PH [Bacillota bacterium]MBT9158594.1 Ribonuclease PH [Bacillota bacterium]